jgi:Na+-driven multidrug efflux pump
VFSNYLLRSLAKPLFALAVSLTLHILKIILNIRIIIGPKAIPFQIG